MNLKSLVPFGGRDPFISLRREIDQLFEDFTKGFPALRERELLPSTDVAETDKTIEITAELPGLEEKDVKINLSDNLLTISGEKKAEKEEKDKNYRRIERSYGAFSRTVELPFGVNPDAITATLSKGVLKVTVQKPAQAAAKKIEVKAAA
jgi:HSP20 family protein